VAAMYDGTQHIVAACGIVMVFRVVVLKECSIECVLFIHKNK
jgi:hypothetical protein